MKIQATLAVLAAAMATFRTGVLSQTVVDIAVGSPDHTTLVAAVLAAGLDRALSEPGPFTVFAPTDAAFSNVPDLEMLLEDQWIGHLQGILLYHVLGSTVLSTDLKNGMTASTLEGSDVVVTLPPVKINTAFVTAADLKATNGVVHVIDEVLIPPFMTTSIVDIAIANPIFSILVDLIILADLADVLSGPGPFTVFAPTNDAFSILDAETIDSLKDPANKDALVNILTYHVLPGIALSNTLVEGLMAQTLQGSEVTITSLEPVMVNDARVVLTDVLASNGVIHVIDTVLIPMDTIATMKPNKAGKKGKKDKKVKGGKKEKKGKKA